MPDGGELWIEAYTEGDRVAVAVSACVSGAAWGASGTVVSCSRTSGRSSEAPGVGSTKQQSFGLKGYVGR